MQNAAPAPAQQAGTAGEAQAPAPPPPEQPTPDANGETIALSNHAVPAGQYGNNSPTKRSSSSEVWKEVKRIKHTLNADNQMTHICLVKLPPLANGTPQFCNTLLKLHKTKAKPGNQPSWLTTRAIDHLREEHPTDGIAGPKYAKAAQDRANATMGNQMSYGMPASDGSQQLGANSLSGFTLTKADKALSAQAQWYAYSSMRISKSEFDSVWFKTMLQTVGDGEKTAILTKEKLVTFVRAEFNVFLLFLKMIMKKKYTISQGNAFAQAMHDGGTLASKRKYQALAVQFVAPEWKGNLVVTIGLLRMLHNADADVANLWKETMRERTGFEYDEIIARMRSDRAAKGVSGQLGMEGEEVCEMHDSDKLGRAAVGSLVRTKNKKAINPFEAGVSFVSRAHKLGTYFGYSDRYEKLAVICTSLGDVAKIKIAVDYNTTRISSVHGLLLSEIRLNRALRAYDLQHKPGWEFAEGDWATATEFEAVLNATRVTATLAQIERGYMGAFTCLIKNLAMSKLRAEKIAVIDLPKVTKSPKLERKEIDISSLSPNGQTARVRATLEGERRWCGNTGETLTGAPVDLNKHELLCMLLDKRTLGCGHVSSEVRKQATDLFEAEYVKFSLRAAAYNRERIAAEQAAAAAAAAAAAQAAGTEPAVKEEGASSGGVTGAALRSGAVFDDTRWSDDEDSLEDSDDVEEVGAEVAALQEAKRVLKAWKKYTVDWRALYPELKDKTELDLTEDLMPIDIGKLYTQLDALDRGQLGWIPVMASSSVGQLGALSAESYCERILSCANNVVVSGNTLLGDAELEMLVVLRMNKEFMQFMREHYAQEAGQQFNATVVRAAA